MKYKIISFSNFRQRTTNPFNSLVLLSSPADAVMMPELKSFTANATPEIHKEIQSYQTYICINMPSWWVCHNHTVSFIIKINHIFCNILIHYNMYGWIIIQVYLCHSYVVFTWMFFRYQCFWPNFLLKFTSLGHSPKSWDLKL